MCQKHTAFVCVCVCVYLPFEVKLRTGSSRQRPCFSAPAVSQREEARLQQLQWQMGVASAPATPRFKAGLQAGVSDKQQDANSVNSNELETNEASQSTFLLLQCLFKVFTQTVYLNNNYDNNFHSYSAFQETQGRFRNTNKNRQQQNRNGP